MNIKTLVAWISVMAVSAALAEPTVYTHYMNPRMHPDDARRDAKPPTWESLGNKTHFMALRHATAENFKRYIDEDKLGDFVWAYWSYFLKDEKQLDNFIREVKKRNAYVLDTYAFLPGSSDELHGNRNEFFMPSWAKQKLEAELGDHWLGMDNGEQDGLYIGAYARGAEPSGRSRYAQYLNFQRHFESMDWHLGNRMSTLVSLTYGHYFLRENCYLMIGAETAQLLPNAQIYYSFIRGAGKQYGVPWWGNVSTFNRWGYKQYPKNPKDEDIGKRDKAHPLNGTSLALMKKLMMAQIFYNSMAVGFEWGYYMKDKDDNDILSPIANVHRECQKWLRDNGQPGVMHAPVAVLFDFYSGWTFQRESYGPNATVWGALNYDEGDFFAHNVLDTVYPGYMDSGFMHNEDGFSVETPYGDLADCLLTDAPEWLLDQYGLVILTTMIEPRIETADKLRGYVRKGGHLVMTAGNGQRLFADGFGDKGNGRVTVLPGDDWGIVDKPVCGLPPGAPDDRKMKNPYPLTPETKVALDAVLREQMIFGTSKAPSENGLSLVTCRRGKGEYTLLISNSSWEEKPFEIVSFAGTITKIEELPLDMKELDDPAYVVDCIDRNIIGKNTENTIVGGGTRTFRVLIDEKVREVAEVQPPANPTERMLFVRDHDNAIGAIKEAVLRRPSFFQQYGGVMLDWRYISGRSKEDIAEQSNWVKLQHLDIGVDFGSGFNLFPDLRIITNNVYEAEKSWRKIDDVLAKMEILGATTAVVTLHQSGFTYPGKRAEFEADFTAGLKTFARKAAAKGITVYMRNTYRRGARSDYETSDTFVAAVGEPNFKAAYAIAYDTLDSSRKLSASAERASAAKAELIYLSVPVYGFAKQFETPFGRLAEAKDHEDLLKAIAYVKKSGAKVVFAPFYADCNEEYRDLNIYDSVK
jgi:hypothetical protein